MPTSNHPILRRPQPRCGNEMPNLESEQQQLLYERCRVEIANAQWERALCILHMLEVFEPHKIEIVLWRAEMLLKLGQSDEAEIYLKHRLQQNPNEPLLQVALAKIDAHALNLHGAIEALEDVLDQEGLSPTVAKWALAIAKRIENIQSGRG